ADCGLRIDCGLRRCSATSHEKPLNLQSNPQFAIRDPKCHGNKAGGTRFFVACSNAYASSISFGSAHAMPVKLTPKGVGFASKPAGNAGVGAFATIANGTITVG